MATKKTTADRAKAPKASPAAQPDLPEADAVPPEPTPEPVVPAARLRGPSLRIKGLVDRVAATTGGKRKEVKQTVEATLTALGDALAGGEELNLPGFGRIRVARSAQRDGASHMTLKVKRGPHKKRDNDETEPLADDGEDG